MSRVIFSNFEYHPEKFYFLYVGELKSYGINYFFQDALKKYLPDKEIDFLAVVPDVFEQYDYDNVIVINPVAEKYSNLSNNKKKVSCRITAMEFYRAVSYNKTVNEIIDNIIKNQGELFVVMYESSIYLELLEHPKIKLIGPNPNLVYKVNNKLFQYKNLKNIIPIVEHKICYNYNEMIENIKTLRKVWDDGIFVTKEYSAGGSNSAIVYNYREAEKIFKGVDSPYIISRYIPHSYDPTVLGVVANENDVYIAGIADQIIVDGNKFTGSTYPSILSEDIQIKLQEYTREIGKFLGSQGYRGIFGCDFIVDDNLNIYFVEINARKQGTTLEFCCTLENCLPEGSPNLPDLELYSVFHNKFPDNTIEPENCTKIHWGTYNFKVPGNTITEGYIPQFKNEREVFKKVAKGKLRKEFMVLEHIGNDFIITTGTFLARVVSVAQNREDMLEGIKFGKKLIENTIFLI